SRVLEKVPIHRNLIGRNDDEIVRLAFRNHGTVHVFTEAHVAGNRSAALAHAVYFALLHIQSGGKGDVGKNVGRLQHALSSQACNHNVSHLAAAHSTSHIP